VARARERPARVVGPVRGHTAMVAHENENDFQ
jgi:hypothetical protein